MAWSVPLTAVSNSALTAAQWNASVRDNLLETAVAKATTGSGEHFASTGVNSIAARQLVVSSNAAVGTLVSTSYNTGLTGTTAVAVTTTTGVFAVWSIHCRQSSSSAGTNVWTSVNISGSTSITGSDARAISYDQAGEIYHGITVMENGLTAGSNQFTMAYRVSGGTGTFANRRIQVVPY